MKIRSNGTPQKHRHGSNPPDETLIVQGNLPGLDDLLISSVCLKVRFYSRFLEAHSHPLQKGKKEADITLQLMAKALEMEFNDGKFVAAVFCVPIVERVTLLSGRGLSDCLIEEGSLVKVHNRRYKNDDGTIVSVSVGYNSLTIKIKSRDPLPGDLKRKRIHRDPYILPKEWAKFLGKGASFQDFSKNKGFRFHNGTYTFDRYLLLDIRYDRVEHIETRIETHIDHDVPINPLSPSTKHLRLQKFLRVGSPVWISGGDLAGAAGFLVEFTSNRTALVDIGESETTLVSAVYEVDLEDIVRRFDLGDIVKIKLGTNMGQHGFVALVNYKKGLDRAVVEIAEIK